MKIGKILVNVFLIILSITFVIPIITLISTSISNEAILVEKGYSIFPTSFDLAAYKFIFKNPTTIINAYKVTITVSLLGAVISVFIMIMCAYVLARKDFKYKKYLNLYLFFPMLFNGGLIPRYILTTQYLHLQNTIWVLILSSLVNLWYIFILRTFIKDIPDAIIESALLDGASEFRIFISLVFPISVPSIATIGLFVLLGYWNEWMTALLYIDKAELYPLQYLLQKILQDLQNVINNMSKMSTVSINDADIPSESVRMALAVVAAGPMLFIMPFFQKYFVRGMTVGSVKG